MAVSKNAPPTYVGSGSVEAIFIEIVRAIYISLTCFWKTSTEILTRGCSSIFRFGYVLVSTF